MKSLFKKFIPERLLLRYHYLRARLAAAWYRHPSREILVIGVTGTKGKTSTGNLVWAVLTAGGYTTGLVGSANIRIGEKEMINAYHMTMPGPFILQRLLRKMARAGCTHCIVETTSEGIKLFRHWGIAYDAAIFTNLTPEHLPSHGGSFEKYRAAKGELFAALQKTPRKTVGGKKIQKVIIANYDSPERDYFLHFWADKKITYGMREGADIRAEILNSTERSVEFAVGAVRYRLPLAGHFNVMNALPAIAVAQENNISPTQIQAGFERLTTIPGRMELIEGGQKFTVFVDYAHERQSMENILLTAKDIVKKTGGKIIVLLGAEGGGRDKAKRPAMGERAGALADYVIITNVDPYDDDPQEILEDIAVAAEKAGKTRGNDLFVIEDRRAGIRKALECARPGDVVFITGKGAEQSMIIKGRSVKWDDRTVVKEELGALLLPR